MRSRYLPILALLLLAGCTGRGTDTTEPVALVTLGKAEEGRVAARETIYGEISRSGGSVVTLVAPIEGTVEMVLPAGSAVAEGAVVARLRPSPQTVAQVKAAEADAAAAVLAFERAGRLRENGLASDADVEAAQSRATGASALAAAFRQQRAGLLLRSPAKGFVDSVAVTPGDQLQAGAVVATLSRKGQMTARFGVPPALARLLALQTPVTVPAGNGIPAFTGHILSVSLDIDPVTRLASVLVAVPADAGVAVGQPLAGEITVQVPKLSVTIPYAAILDDGGQPYVFVVKDGAAHRRDVVTGASDGVRIAIRKGVTAGENLVLAGGTAVEDGMKVRTR